MNNKIPTIFDGSDVDKRWYVNVSDFLRAECIQVTKTFFVHKEIYSEYLHIQNNKLPCGYAWFSANELEIAMKERFKSHISIKNGQTSTGNIKSRVTSFETTGVQILIDVLGDSSFKERNFDQKLNSKIETDYYEKYGIEVDHSNTTRTKENVLVPLEYLFDFPQIKRNSLTSLINRTLTKRLFYPNESHIQCLKLLTAPSSCEFQYFLLECVMRFGKSFIYLEYIKQTYSDKNINKIHTVFCHDTKTIDGWLTKIDIYYTDIFDYIILKKDKSFDFTKPVEKNTIVFISQQLLHSNKDFTDLSEVYTKPLDELINLKIKAENTFVDEVHQYFSPRWKSYYEIITENKIILASGTAANIKLKYNDLFDEYNNYIDTFFDLKQRMYNDYLIDIVANIRRINVSDIGSEFVNMANLQAIDEFGKLLNPALADKFFNKLFVSGFRTSPMLPDQISPGNTKHCPILVDTRDFGRAMFNFLIERPHLGIIPIMMTGEGKERTVGSETELIEFIKKADLAGKSTVMITCGSMIQGVSNEYWKELINLSVVATYESFYQFLGRGWEIDVVKMQGKIVNITMWDYNPHRTLRVGAEFIKGMAMTNGLNFPEAFKYYFQIHNIWDYVPERNSFVQASFKAIESEIRSLIDSQILTRGCKARLVTNTRQYILGDMGDSLLETLLNTQPGKNSAILIELKSYRSKLNKQKTNYSKKSHDLAIPNISISNPEYWEKIINGLSVYTERIPIVTEVMFSEGKLKTKNVMELMANSSDESFITGFGFPNSKVSKEFASHIIKYGDKIKINNKINNSINLIPSIVDCLDMSLEQFLEVGKQYDNIYKYGKDDNQLTVKDIFYILNDEFKNIKVSIGDTFHIKHAKSGSINLALGYLLKLKSKQIFGTQLTNNEIIKMITYEDENAFFNSLNNAMGFVCNRLDKKKFIIINPPYKNGLHIKIFNKTFEKLNEGGTIICIHPSTPFINRKPTNRTKEEQKIIEIVSDYKTRLTFFDGNKVFNAGFFVPLSITRVEKVKNKNIEVVYSHTDENNKNVKVYDDINNIFIHGNDLVLSIRDKVFQRMKTSIESKLYRNGAVGKYYLNINRIAGHPPKHSKLNPDFYCLIYKADEYSIDNIITKTPIGKRSDGNQFNEIVIKTTDNCKFIHSYLMTKFARFCLSLYKTGANILSDLKAVPYMDFSQEWTDEKLFDHFDLNQEERDYINEYIGNWYDSDFK